VTSEQHAPFDVDRLLDMEGIRRRLMQAGLFLAAYEVLKLAAIEGTRSHLVAAPEMTPERYQRLRESIGEKRAQEAQREYAASVARYEAETGVNDAERERVGLIPSCEWLSRTGALSDNDVLDIREVREHRNLLAHEIPHLLIRKGFEVNLRHLSRIRELVRRIDIFFIRAEAGLESITDDDIVPSRLLELDHVIDVAALLRPGGQLQV